MEDVPPLVTFLGASRVSNVLVPLTRSAVEKIGAYHLGEEALRNYVSGHEGDGGSDGEVKLLPSELLLAVQHINDLPAKAIMLDAYGGERRWGNWGWVVLCVLIRHSGAHTNSTHCDSHTVHRSYSRPRGQCEHDER